MGGIPKIAMDTLLIVGLVGFAIWYLSSQQQQNSIAGGGSAGGGGTTGGGGAVPPPNTTNTGGGHIVPLGTDPNGGRSNGGSGTTPSPYQQPPGGGNPNYPGVSPTYIPGTMSTSGGATYSTGLVNNTTTNTTTYVAPPAPQVPYAANITPASTVQGSISSVVAATMVPTGSTAPESPGHVTLQQTFTLISALYPAWQQLYPDQWSSIFGTVTGINTVPHAGDLSIDGNQPMTFANWWQALVPYAIQNMGLSGAPMVPWGYA